jgi:hypothetical protein
MKSSGKVAGCTSTWAPAATTHRDATRRGRHPRPTAADGLRKPRPDSGDHASPSRTRPRQPAPRGRQRASRCRASEDETQCGLLLSWSGVAWPSWSSSRRCWSSSPATRPSAAGRPGLRQTLILLPGFGQVGARSCPHRRSQRGAGRLRVGRRRPNSPAQLAARPAAGTTSGRRRRSRVA